MAFEVAEASTSQKAAAILDALSHLRRERDCLPAGRTHAPNPLPLVAISN